MTAGSRSSAIMALYWLTVHVLQSVMAQLLLIAQLNCLILIALYILMSCQKYITCLYPAGSGHSQCSTARLAGDGVRVLRPASREWAAAICGAAAAGAGQRAAG